MSDDPAYSLALSEAEVARYRMMAAIARATEADAWTRAGMVPGARIADVGCGPGLVLAELADLVGPDGSVIGIDRGRAEVDTALAMLAAAGATNGTARQADAWDTGIERGSVDVVNIRHVLAHNTAAHQHDIVAHALDLLPPGGHLYVVDVDLTAARMDPFDPDIDDLTATYVRHLVDTGRDPAIGPRLGSLALDVGFELVERIPAVIMPPSVALTTIRPPSWAACDAMLASGHATAEDVERWDAALTRFAATAIERHAAFYNPVYAVIARRPG